MSVDILIASRDKDQNRSFQPTLYLSSAVEVGLSLHFCSHTFILSYLTKTSVTVKTYQISMCSFSLFVPFIQRPLNFVCRVSPFYTHFCVPYKFMVSVITSFPYFTCFVTEMRKREIGDGQNHQSL